MKVLFRGIGIDSKRDLFKNDWVKGNLLNDCTIGEVGIGLESYSYSEVDPKTVGQYIGFENVLGDNIFEGDLVTHPRIKCVCVIKRSREHSSFIMASYKQGITGGLERSIDKARAGNLTTIGTIHDKS